MQTVLLGLVVMSIQVQRMTVWGGSRPASLGRRQTACRPMSPNKNATSALMCLHIA
jgi:hypothetical protein